MGIFDLFNRRAVQLNTVEAMDTHNQEKPLPEIEERIFIEHAPQTDQRQISKEQIILPKPPMETQTSTDNNIALLYHFLDRNHEAKGYDDALLNPDTTHLQQNLEALKNELVRTINKVKTFYEDFIQETEYHILSRGRSGMVDIVEELEMKKRIALGHMEKVKEIEDNVEKNEGDCKGIIISYTRGFKNGLAAISHHNILTRKF
ncbi:hypothetical protein GCM10027037_28700 [Mucilaginibacter koreensis]